MVYSINQIICVTFLIILVVHGKRRKMDTPKILLITESDSFSHHNNSYSSYTKNKNYTLKHNNHKLLLISCMSNKPIQWLWKEESGDSEKPIVESLTKERRELNNSGVIYSSNLTIHLYKDEPLPSNFSCLFRDDIEGNKYLGNQSISCAEVQYNNQAEPPTLRVVVTDGIPFKDCTTKLDQPPSVNNYSMGLKVDLHNEEVTCLTFGIGGKTCFNLDACYVFALTLPCTKTPHLKGNNSQQEKRSLRESKNQKFPQILYCLKSFESCWAYYAQIYPGFQDKSLKKIVYHETLQEARRKNAVQLFIIPLEEKLDKHLQMDKLTIRWQFADGEDVRFLCAALKYLFMKGFRWKVDNKTISDFETGNSTSSILDQDESTDDMYLLNRVIKMNSTKYGNFSSVSCHAPVWNSNKEFVESSVNIFLYPAVPPQAKITCEDDGKFINCSCLYTGWPRPQIIWHSNESDILNLNVAKPSDLEISNENTHPHNKSWKAENKFIKPQIDFSHPLEITCAARNFLGGFNTRAKIENTSYKWYIIITSILTSTFVLTAVIVLIYWKYGRRKVIQYSARPTLSREEIDEFYSGATQTSTTYEALLLPYKSEYEVAKDAVVLDGSILGSGQFGLVLKGSIGSLPVAVKTINPTADLIYFKSLLSELKILQFVGPHPSIVNLIGANTANIEKGEVFLILDFCSNGSLLSLLRLCRPKFIDFFKDSCSEEDRLPIYENCTDILLTTNNLIGFGTEIACGLDYLASKNVIHGDLAARNVLVTENLQAKICDFGLSKQLLHYTVYVQKVDCPLPLRWMAVESLQDMEFSLASDKWSYGVVLWEIFSLGQLPYPGEEWSFNCYQRLMEGYRMAKPKYANDSIYRMMLECWNAQPQQRPSYQYIVSQLKKEEEMLT